MRLSRSLPSSLLALAALVTAALAALSFGAGRASAAGESLAWKLGLDEGLVYKLGGADAKTLADGGEDERTLFGGEIDRDGRSLVLPVGRVADLAWKALFELPSGPIEVGARYPVSVLHTEPPWNLGPIQVEGEARVVKKQGAMVQIETRWKLTKGAKAHGDARFESGTLVAMTIFHAKKGQIASGEVTIEWTERQGTPPASKPLSLKGTIELSRPIALAPDKSRKRADDAVRRAVDKELKPSIERAIWRQKADEHKLGWLGALLYAGVKAGMDPQAAPLAKAFDEIETLPWKNTYSVSLALMALESRSVRRVKRPGESRVRFEKEAVEKRDLALMEKLTKWLVDARFPGRGYWGYASYTEEGGKGERLGNGDLSVTQFATLALHAAARSGVKVPADVWRELGDMLLANQDGSGLKVPADLRFEPGAPLARVLGLESVETEGAAQGGGTAARPGSRSSAGPSYPARGFMYAPPGHWRNTTGAMTGAGVSSAVIVRQWLMTLKLLDDDRKKKLETAIRDGLVWLQQRGGTRFNFPENPWQPYYYLYSIEKGFELARVERAGGRDWWAEGVEELMLREKPGGGWGGEQYETAFAILFLTRASTEPDFEVREAGREASGGPVNPADEDAVSVDGVGLVSVKEVLRATEVRDAEKRRERLSLAEKAVQALDEEKRPILAPSLGKLQASAYPDVKRFAEKALREIAGERVEDEGAARAYLARWDDTRKLGLSGDPDKIPDLRERLSKDRFPSERRAAALALSRLRAFEAIPDLAGELERPGDKAHRAYIHRVLVGTIGKDLGAEAAPWRAFHAESGKSLLAKEELRRDVRRLARIETRLGARERVLAKGKDALRPLIDALEPPPATGGNGAAADEARALALRSEAASLLREITGQDFGDDRARWDAWWREQAKEGG